MVITLGQLDYSFISHDFFDYNRKRRRGKLTLREGSGYMEGRRRRRKGIEGMNT